MFLVAFRIIATALLEIVVNQSGGLEVIDSWIAGRGMIRYYVGPLDNLVNTRDNNVPPACEWIKANFNNITKHRL